MAFHGLRHPTLTGAEPGQLFGVAEAGLDVPATALAVEQHLPAPMEFVATTSRTGPYSGRDTVPIQAQVLPAIRWRGSRRAHASTGWVRLWCVTRAFPFNVLTQRIRCSFNHLVNQRALYQLSKVT